ncbi:MAG: YARHG domain-containing protein [Nitrospirota bacterium]|nr:YARHG domain-containing protein [Nitrospirota bacterium]
MRKILFLFVAVCVVVTAGTAFGGDWNLAKNVKRLEWVAADYKEDKEIDKKFLEVLAMTEKTKKPHEVYEEAKRIAAIPALNQSKYMDSFLYYLFINSFSFSKTGMAEPDYWLGLLKTYDKSPHMLPALLVRLRALPKNSPEIRRDAQLIVDWVKAQKPDLKVRAPEYVGNILLGYKPRSNFAEGAPLKLYHLSYYMETVTPAEGFGETDTYVHLLSLISEGREDAFAEMASLYRKMGKRKEASDALYRQAMLKVVGKDLAQAKTLLDDAVKLNPENTLAVKERDRIKLELTYQSLAPAAPAAAPASAPQEKTGDAPAIPEHLHKVESYLTPADRVITAAEMAGWSKAELRVMRNEVFARHGRIFQSPDLQDYFSKKAWYRQNASYSDNLLSDVDKENVRIIQEHEDKAK